MNHDQSSGRGNINKEWPIKSQTLEKRHGASRSKTRPMSSREARLEREQSWTESKETNYGEKKLETGNKKNPLGGYNIKSAEDAPQTACQI